MTTAIFDADLFPEVTPRIAGEMANDRYTTTPTLAWCRKVLGVGGFDLDVAACVEAHHAPRWYGWADYADRKQPRQDNEFTNALTHPWNAGRIWCNPPYDDLEPWVAKAWATMLEFKEQRPIIGMLIPDNRREQPFWQDFIEPYRDGRRERRLPPFLDRMFVDAEVAHDAGARLFTHSLPGRQPFGVPGNPEGKGQQSPPFGVVLLEWRFA